jgi:hypothetical protein
MHASPAEVSFCAKHEYAIKPAIVADYNMCMVLLAKQIGWQTVIPLVIGPGNGQRNCSSIY